jgi:hypothetical protein
MPNSERKSNRRLAPELLIRWSTLEAVCDSILDECERCEKAAASEDVVLWMRAYASGANRVLHELMPSEKHDTVNEP